MNRSGAPAGISHKHKSRAMNLAFLLCDDLQSH